MTTPTPKKKWNGCLIAVVIVLLILVGGMVLGRQQVRKLWNLGKEVFSLQAEVEEAFDLPEVGVHWQVRGDASTLDVEVDASELDEMTDSDREELAKAIAQFVKTRLKSLEPDTLSVTFVWKSGILKNSKDYRFDPATLNDE